MSYPDVNRKAWLAIALVLSCIVMVPNVFNDWVNWDDEAFVLNNPLVRELSVGLVSEVFSTIDSNGGYTPMVLLSWSLDYSIADYNAHVFHATNVFLHVVNVAVVFWFILLLSNRVGIAAFTAILFGIHPVQLEPVAWVTSRKDLLYALFYLAGLVAYLKYLNKSARDWRFLLGCFILFLGSLFSKGMAVSFPIVLIVIDIVKQRRGLVKLAMEKIPFFALSIVFGLVAMAGQNKAGAVDDIQNISFIKSFFVACYGLVTYLVKALIPIHLSPYHPYPFSPLEEMPWYLYAAVIPAFAFVLGALYLLSKQRLMAFGAFFFLCTIGMVLQFFPVGVAIVAERFSYVANIGLFFMIAMAADQLVERTDIDKRHLFYTISIYMGVLGTVTFNRASIWENSETLWTEVIRKYPSDFLAYNNRAGYYAGIGKYQLAIADFSFALELQPKAVQVYKDRGFLFLEIGNFSNAFSDFNKVVSINPYDSYAYANRGLALLNMKRYEEALKDFNLSLNLDDNNPIVYFNRGLANGLRGDYGQAVADFDHCLSIDSNYEPALEWKVKWQNEL